MKILQATSAVSRTATNQSSHRCTMRPTFLQFAALALVTLAILFCSRPVAADYWGNEETIRSALEKSGYSMENAALLESSNFNFTETAFQIRDIRIQSTSPAPDQIPNSNQSIIRAIDTGYANRNQVHVTIGIIYFFLNTNRSIDELSVLQNNGSLTVSYSDKNLTHEQDKPKDKSSYLKKDTVYPIFAFSLKF